MLLVFCWSWTHAQEGFFFSRHGLSLLENVRKFLAVGNSSNKQWYFDILLQVIKNAELYKGVQF